MADYEPSKPYVGADFSELLDRLGIAYPSLPTATAGGELTEEFTAYWRHMGGAELSKLANECRRFLAALTCTVEQSDAPGYAPLWAGLGKVEGDDDFLSVFSTLLPWMWV